MDEPPQKSGAHTAKHGRKTSTMEVAGSEATIRFSPAVLDALQHLHGQALAHGHEKFDQDAASILRGMAYGQTMPLEQTLSCLVTVCAEAGKCHVKTGGFRVLQALERVQSSLNGALQESMNANPTTLTIGPKAKGRG